MLINLFMRYCWIKNKLLNSLWKTFNLKKLCHNRWSFNVFKSLQQNRDQFITIKEKKKNLKTWFKILRKWRLLLDLHIINSCAIRKIFYLKSLNMKYLCSHNEINQLWCLFVLSCIKTITYNPSLYSCSRGMGQTTSFNNTKT